jgi:uncharacterized Zn finger protein
MAKRETGADVKSRFKTLSEADIRQASADEVSFQRGYDYYLRDAIVEPTLNGSVLRALCHGSSWSPYRVEVTLVLAKEKSAHKLISAVCSCPRGDFCKHLVALLLTWLSRPERIVVRTGLMGRLSEKSHEELLVLLEELMQKQPDIESLVEMLIELPLTTAAQQEKRPGKGRERTLDPSIISSQVHSAFYRAGDDWDAASRVAPELEKLCDIGKNFARAGEWANAQVVYATLAQETIHQYYKLQDEGQVSWVLDECAAGLVECLEAQSTLPQEERLDALAREELLTMLFDLWKFGDRYAGIEADIAGTIAEHGTKRERQRVETWLREQMRPGQDFSSKWHNRSIIDFLAILKQTDHFSDEDLLEEYRLVGLYKEMAEKLLQLGRENEALEIAQAHLVETMDVTRFAEQLLKSGEKWQEQALAFVEKRLAEIKPTPSGKSQDFSSARTIDTYRHWLSEKYLLYKKAKQALDMELARFWANLDHATYRSIRLASQAVDQSEELWPQLRLQLIQTLEQQGRWGTLVSIYLDEGEVGQAIAALAKIERSPKTPLSGYTYRAETDPSAYQAQVAKAAEESYPDEAIRLYKPVVQRLIDGRGRENYQQAAGYLTRIRQLYQKQEQETEWDAYITNLRNSNKSLRALKEELEKKGL